MAARAPDELLEQLHPRRADGEVDELDLRAVDWVRPAVMVGVAGLAHRASAEGRRLRVRGPSRPELAGYAVRMRLARLLDDLEVEHDLPPPRRERDQAEHLVELSMIDGDRAAERLARLVHRKLEPVDAALAGALHRSVGEIGANAPEHSGSVGFMAAQTLPRRRELLLAVGDAGVGMRETLLHRGAEDDEHAIELATREHVSRFDASDRGRGLPTALTLITGQRGNLYIASGTASIRHFAHTRRYLAGRHPYPGTLLEARIPLT
jgi:hypothetical protein